LGKKRLLNAPRRVVRHGPRAEWDIVRTVTNRPPQDTSLGGERARFPETTQGVRDLVGPSADRASFEVLCRRYWKPVYAYVRIAWRKGNEDAKDLAQAFFLWLIEGDALRSYDARKGGFRTYLRVLLKRFVGHEERALGRLKRGGGVNVVSLEGEAPALREVADPAAADPEQVFEKVWFEELVEGAVGRVRERCVADGHELRFRLYQEFTSAARSERPSYADLAARHGLKVSDVENWLFRIREDIRAELRTTLAQSTASAQEFDDEWKRLFGS
jgi:RNA polymerase sigma-70 factor (ECF subfamily)